MVTEASVVMVLKEEIPASVQAVTRGNVDLAATATATKVTIKTKVTTNPVRRVAEVVLPCVLRDR